MNGAVGTCLRDTDNVHGVVLLTGKGSSGSRHTMRHSTELGDSRCILTGKSSQVQDYLLLSVTDIACGFLKKIIERTTTIPPPQSIAFQRAGGVVTKVIESNSPIPEDEVNNQKIEAMHGLESDDSGEVPVDAQGHPVVGSVHQGWDFASTEQHREPRVQIRLAPEQGFHLPGCHHVRMLCWLPVSLGMGLLKCGVLVGAGRPLTLHGLSRQVVVC